MRLAPSIFKNALIVLYGEDGHVKKFASQIGRHPKTVYKWIRTNTTPRWAIRILTLMVRDKKRNQTNEN